MVVEDAQTGFVGAVVRIEYGRMELEDRHGRRKPFPVGPGYLIDGRPVDPHRAATGRAAQRPRARLRARWRYPSARAKVALASRIYVEGRHDAELVEQVWGDDLRVEGVVVEYLGGVDDLVGDRRGVPARPRPPARRARRPPRGRLEGGPHRRRGPPRTRWRAHARRRPSLHRHLAGGQARPAWHLGMAGHPRGIDWKHGVCQALGWPHSPAGRHRAGRGSGSGAGCATGTISSPRSSAGSRN